jgi:hypothetical protein
MNETESKFIILETRYGLFKLNLTTGQSWKLSGRDLNCWLSLPEKEDAKSD